MLFIVMDLEILSDVIAIISLLIVGIVQFKYIDNIMFVTRLPNDVPTDTRLKRMFVQ